MAQAFVRFTDERNLPKTHVVWFKARVLYAETLLYSAQSEEDFECAQDQIKVLLRLVEEECATLAADWWGDEAMGQLLLMLGRAHEAFAGALKVSNGMDQPIKDVRKSALLCCEKALKHFNYAAGRGMSLYLPPRSNKQKI